MGAIVDVLKLALTQPRALLRAVKRAPLVQRGLRLAPDMNGQADGAPRDHQLRRYFRARRSTILKLDHYLDVYERHLARFVGTRAMLLEIGVLSGGSLEMWRDYLGPQATILGVDINPGCAAHRGEQIEIFVGSQSDAQFLASIRPACELSAVIDDGSHVTSDQIASFEALFPRLAPGGVYICEDIASSDNGFLDYLHGLTKNLNAINPVLGGGAVDPNALQRSVESITVYPYIAVIEKRSHQRGRIASTWD